MPEPLKRKVYEAELADLRAQLVRFQGFVKQSRARVLIIVEGRDASGKGGAIKRFTEPLNPRGCRVVALVLNKGKVAGLISATDLVRQVSML